MSGDAAQLFFRREEAAKLHDLDDWEGCDSFAE
jgi:hypothetical protein